MRTSFLLAAGLAAALTAAPAPAQSFDTIAFGSCAREREPQPVWTEIIAKDPDLFLFIGDNQYADFWYEGGKRVMKPIPNIERLEEAYRDLGNQPGYRRMQRQCPIMATWDDHDYGANDAGNDFYLRAESQQVFLDFYGFPENAPIRDQEGIYHARSFGEPGKRVQVIMLDTRYHRDPLDRASPGERRGGPYTPTRDESKTMLGEAQWEWLEAQLRQPADVRIIASSIQVVADEHGWETWGNFPHERRRLYDLIDETDAAGVVFVTGDRHLMEITREPGDLAGREAPYPMWDFTSSGMNERPRPATDPNSLRVGPVMRETNFGLVRIEWAESNEDTKIHLEGYGDQGQLLTRQTVWLADLRED